MPVIADARDPRSIITPDAFEVEPDLLGRPLATPMQRLVAILIDLAVIGLITLATKSFGFLLGIVAAVFFVRAGFKRTPVRGSVFNRAMRLSVGCLGLVIALGTGIGWLALHYSSSTHGGTRSEPVPGVVTGRLSDALSVARGATALRRAHSSAEARTALAQIVTTFKGLGLHDDEIRQNVLQIVPKDAAWSAEAPALVDDLLAANPEAPLAASAPTAPAASPDVSTLSTAGAMDAYARLLRSGARDSASVARLAALRSRLLDTLAADTLRALQERLDVESSLAASRGQQLDELRANSNGKKGGGIFAWIKSVVGGAVNELGFGFGWASIYLTIMTSWWKGQTVGKRIMKIRVLRLDGEPITWWAAFERAGGYAAGFATGLLGFAQVYWDANRQCIHDRISGTVVVRDGAPKVLDWQDAL